MRINDLINSGVLSREEARRNQFVIDLLNQSKNTCILLQENPQVKPFVLKIKSGQTFRALKNPFIVKLILTQNISEEQFLQISNPQTLAAFNNNNIQELLTDGIINIDHILAITTVETRLFFSGENANTYLREKKLTPKQALDINDINTRHNLENPNDFHLIMNGFVDIDRYLTHLNKDEHISDSEDKSEINLRRGQRKKHY